MMVVTYIKQLLGNIGSIGGIIKMLSNTEAKLKKAVLIKACILSVFAKTIHKL